MYSMKDYFLSISLETIANFFIIMTILIVAIIMISTFCFSCYKDKVNQKINMTKNNLIESLQECTLYQNYISLEIYLNKHNICLQELSYIEGFLDVQDIDVSDSLFRESIATINKSLLKIDDCFVNQILNNLQYIDNYFKNRHYK